MASGLNIRPSRFLLLASVLCLAACGQPLQPQASFETRFPLAIDQTQLSARVAFHPEEQQRGLMHVLEIPANEGMLFVYREPEQRAFWMKNTHLPLDIGFFDSEGTLLEVRELVPFDETPVSSTSRNVVMAIEMNRGWFQNHSIKPGAKLDLNRVRAALDARDISLPLFLRE